MSDLAARIPPDGLRGLIDRSGRAWRLFDVDPSHMASLQAPSVDDPTRPPVQRPRAASTAPGYPGRKRADAIRTRLAVLLSHAGMWLTGMAQPGNGHRAAFLDYACTQILALCSAVKVPCESVVVRTDGEFGSLAQIAQIAGHKLGWLVRAKDYATLLRHPDVRAVLSRGSERRMTLPDSPIVRELFDVPELEWRSLDGRHCVRTRLVVTRTPWPSDWGKPAVGHLHEGFVYELFVTSLPADAASAAEIVSLYLARGALEATLAQEDREMPTDRWITHRAHGQDLFQMVCQWSWNHRVALGSVLASKSALRITPWDVAVTPVEPTPLASLPDATSAVPQTHADATAPVGDAGATPDATTPVGDASATPDATTPVGDASATPRDERFGPESFSRDEQGRVHCPSGQLMRPSEIRRRRSGDRQRYRAPLAACVACAMASRCCQKTGTKLQGRIVDLPMGPGVLPGLEAGEAPREAPAVPLSEGPARPRRHLPVQVHGRLLWTDLKACEMRRSFVDALWSEHVEITRKASPVASSPSLYTRDQRAHRRATWAERLARNDLGSTATTLTLQVHGVSQALARLIGASTGAPSAASRTPAAQEDPGWMVATT